MTIGVNSQDRRKTFMVVQETYLLQKTFFLSKLREMLDLRKIKKRDDMA